MTSCAQLLRAAKPIALVLAVAVAAAGCASGGSRSATAGASIGVPPAQTATQQHEFSPDVAVAPTTAKRKGTCWTTSIAVPRQGAYRCLAGNTILDPCFPAKPTSRHLTVACYADPWSKPTYLTLSDRLPRVDGALPGSHPWALQLADGIRCVAVTGTVQVVGNVPLTYACVNGAAAGLTDSVDAQRTAFYRANAHAPLQQMAVTDVWIG